MTIEEILQDISGALEHGLEGALGQLERLATQYPDAAAPLGQLAAAVKEVAAAHIPAEALGAIGAGVLAELAHGHPGVNPHPGRTA